MILVGAYLFVMCVIYFISSLDRLEAATLGFLIGTIATMAFTALVLEGVIR